ncbi:hypothetical protein [Rhizobium herbae]|uniref:Uncharacterized protein n=1 Tax=Rhizobium herbae TaxID=508661 RepID=A0ABS4ER65_9HYPH|nr:hypothetical protein [Rhizobium herbae]MBP1860445.1 hypothetical protein [Rhizobium herbae]
MTMNMRQTWYRVLPETDRGPGIRIGVFAVIIGLFCTVAYNSRQEVAVAPIDTKDRIAADLGKREDNQTKLQAAVDASPAFQVALAMKPDLPATAIPSMKPVSSPRRAISHADIKKAAVETTMPSGVLRFDRCQPQCETHDPLIVGYTAPRQYSEEAPLIAHNGDDEGFNLSPLQGARYIFARTAELPRSALRRGREVLDSIVRAD